MGSIRKSELINLALLFMLIFDNYELRINLAVVVLTQYVVTFFDVLDAGFDHLVPKALPDHSAFSKAFSYYFSCMSDLGWLSIREC